VQHVALSSVVFGDAIGDVARVGDETRRPLRRSTIPFDQALHKRLRQTWNVLVSGEGEAADRIDVADVDRSRRHGYALCPRGRRADDRVVAAQVERFEGARIKRRQDSKISIRQRNAGQIRAAHALRRKEIADDALVVKRGKNGRLGPGPSDLGEDAFGAAALVQVVVNECDVNLEGLFREEARERSSGCRDRFGQRAERRPASSPRSLATRVR